MGTSRDLARWQALYEGLEMHRFGVSLDLFQTEPHRALVTASRHPSWPEFARRHLASPTDLAKLFADERGLARGTEADRARGTALHAAHDAMVRRYQAH
ncbi:hypothetical protein [Azospirillum sp. sgz302134]